MHFYIYTDGHHAHLWSFDELLIALDDENGTGIRLPHAMTEEEFFTYIAAQENQIVHYWFYSTIWINEGDEGPGYYPVWHKADIELYNENHHLFGCVDGHEEYLETCR